MTQWLKLRSYLAAEDLLASYYRILDWAAEVTMEIRTGTRIGGGGDDELSMIDDRALFFSFLSFFSSFPFLPFLFLRRQRNRITNGIGGS